MGKTASKTFRGRSAAEDAPPRPPGQPRVAPEAGVLYCFVGEEELRRLLGKMAAAELASAALRACLD